MSRAVPRIGIDRYLDRAWMSLAAEVARGETNPADLAARLALDLPANEVRIKTIGILNRIWFPTEDKRKALTADAAQYAGTQRADAGKASFIAVTTAAYPFFGEVLETIGRLINIQGSCTPGEVHRRMFERHGESRTVSLADARVFRTLVDWDVLSRAPDKRLIPTQAVPISEPGRELLDRAANIARRTVTPLSTSDPLLFPFRDRRA